MATEPTTFRAMMESKQQAYCPDCFFFGWECHPDEQDYREPCDAFVTELTGEEEWPLPWQEA